MGNVFRRGPGQHVRRTRLAPEIGVQGRDAGVVAAHDHDLSANAVPGQRGRDGAFGQGFKPQAVPSVILDDAIG